jgi:2-keto-3-deoxy-L-rhamnonate aldolase RhmA
MPAKKTNTAMNDRGNSGRSTEGPGRLLKRRLREGQLLLGGMIYEYARPSLVKIYVEAGFDFLYIENEHTTFGAAALADTILCARDNGLPVIAKTPQLERGAVAKLLELGVVGIQLPRTETRREVETLRSFLKFPPQGTRAVAPGWGNSSYRSVDDWQGWMDQQDAETTLVVHIETRRGYENIEEIVSTPGVDLVYVGPGDFSVEMGHPGDYDHPDVSGPIHQILEVCNKHDIPFGTTPTDAAAAAEWAGRGACFFESIDEWSLLREGAARFVREHRGG